MIDVKCEYCEKEFKTPIWEYNKFLKGKKKHILCSRLCANKLIGKNHIGKNNPRYVEKNKTLCDYCGKEYEIYDNQIGISKYCSKECMGKSKTEKASVALNCQYCNKEFFVLKGQLDFFGELKYCSKECRELARIKKADLICIICGKHYFVSNNRKNSSICCSRNCLNKWTSEIYTKIPEVKERLSKQGTRSQLKQKSSYTLPEMLVLEYLIKNNINFIPQYVVGDILIIDFFLEKYNCCLEVYGDYWHSNPRIYGNNKKPLNDIQKKNKQKDIKKYNVLTKNYKFFFYCLWEYDIKNNLEEAMNKFFKYIDSKIRNEQIVL